MKFIIDAHLPKSIAAFFPGHEVIRTSQLEAGNRTKDNIINTLSLEQNCILITKDTDFHYSFVAAKRPYKLVLIKVGNMRLKELHDYFKRNAATIQKLLLEHSFLIVEPARIRVLE